MRQQELKNYKPTSSDIYIKELEGENKMTKKIIYAENMTLRDAFALAAMQALVTASFNEEINDVDYQEVPVARSAYELADVMLEVREVENLNKTY